MEGLEHLLLRSVTSAAPPHRIFALPYRSGE